MFHLQRNHKFCPTINTDKLWTLVSEQTRTNASKVKGVAPVIDVTKSVSFLFFKFHLYIRDTSKFSEKEFSQKFQSLLRLSYSQRQLRKESRKLEEPVFSLHEKPDLAIYVFIMNMDFQKTQDNHDL